MKDKLSTSEVQSRLENLPGWSLKNNCLFKNFEFKSFREAFSFMTFAAMISEKLNHHPDWKNSYKVVEVSLSTHDAGGITQLDFDWAEKVSKAPGVVR